MFRDIGAGHVGDEMDAQLCLLYGFSAAHTILGPVRTANADVDDIGDWLS